MWHNHAYMYLYDWMHICAYMNIWLNMRSYSPYTLYTCLCIYICITIYIWIDSCASCFIVLLINYVFMWIHVIFHYNKVVGGAGVYWFHSICPSVCPASRFRSVVPTVLVGSIAYLYILSSNFRRCVACKVSSKTSKFYFLAIFSVKTVVLSRAGCTQMKILFQHM